MTPEHRESARLAFKAKNELRKRIPKTPEERRKRLIRQAVGGKFAVTYKGIEPHYTY